MVGDTFWSFKNTVREKGNIVVLFNPVVQSDMKAAWT